MEFVKRMIHVDKGEEPIAVLASDAIKDPSDLAKNLLNTWGRKEVRSYIYPRSSEMEDICPREWIFGMGSEDKRERRIPFPMTIQMGIGSAMHTYYQNGNELFPKDKKRGWWRCRACKTTLPFGPKPEGRCPNCGAFPEAIFYKEHYFSLSEPFYATAKYDMILELIPGLNRLFELKSVAEFEKDKTLLPRGGDIIQVACYLYFSKFDKSLPVKLDSKVGYLVYVSKKMNFKTPVLVYPVHLGIAMENTLRVPLMTVKVGLDEGLIPAPITICAGTDYSSKRARECTFKERCREYGYRDDFIGQEDKLLI